LVEGCEELLRRAPELAKAPCAQAVGCVTEGPRGPICPGRQGDRRNAARNEWALLVERVRKGEVNELSERARPPWARSGLFENAGGGGRHEHRSRRSCRVTRELDPSGLPPGDRVEVDDGNDTGALGLGGGEVLGAERAERAPVGGEKDDRVRRLHRLCARAGGGLRRRSCVCASELDQSGRPRGVVVRARRDAEVVAMRHDNDSVGRPPDHRRRQVLQSHASVAGDVRCELVDLGRKAVRRKLACEPVCGAECARCPRKPVGIGAREIGGERPGAGRVE
jgi:hypothetical protein